VAEIDFTFSFKWMTWPLEATCKGDIYCHWLWQISWGISHERYVHRGLQWQCKV